MSAPAGRSSILREQRPQRRRPVRRAAGPRPPRGPRQTGAWLLALAIIAVAAAAVRAMLAPPAPANAVDDAAVDDAAVAGPESEDDAVETDPGEASTDRSAEEAALAAAVAAEDAADHALPQSFARQRFGPADPFVTLGIRVEARETLFQALLRGGLPHREASRVVAGLTSHLDFRTLRVGDRFDGTLWLGEELIDASFQHGVRDRYQLTPVDGKFVATLNRVPLQAVTTVVAGEVKSSLFEAIYVAGEAPSLIMSFVELFSWDFDFSTETRVGDRFAMLVEKRFLEGQFLDYGPIGAARYENGERSFAVCNYAPSDAPDVAGYYHPDGSSVRGAFLRAPVRNPRITSGFTYARFHPVLKRARPHRAIDYGAPIGTPVFTVGDGLVIGAGWMGGAGNTVRVKHPNGWVTSYSHLSRVLVKKGQRVRQGQLVAKSGNTGLSTGPHVHYALSINDRFVNPLSVKFPRGESIPRVHLATFQHQCEAALARVDAGEATTVARAGGAASAGNTP